MNGRRNAYILEYTSEYITCKEHTQRKCKAKRTTRRGRKTKESEKNTRKKKEIFTKSPIFVFLFSCSFSMFSWGWRPRCFCSELLPGAGIFFPFGLVGSCSAPSLSFPPGFTFYFPHFFQFPPTPPPFSFLDGWYDYNPPSRCRLRTTFYISLHPSLCTPHSADVCVKGGGWFVVGHCFCRRHPLFPFLSFSPIHFSPVLSISQLDQFSAFGSEADLAGAECSTAHFANRRDLHDHDICTLGRMTFHICLHACMPKGQA